MARRRIRLDQDDVIKVLTPKETQKKAKKTSASLMGKTPFRGVKFWLRAANIYFSYKKAQLYCNFFIPLVDEHEKEELRKITWQETHDLNSDRLLALCLDLRGFYLKTGQFLGTRHDFMPQVYLKKLGMLHDDVPAMSPAEVRKVMKAELGKNWEEIFEELNLEQPLGSASISQVHRGVLKENKSPVAVKVQYPGAEKTMTRDLSNLKVLASFLQKFELDFDVLSSIRELSRQIKYEFNFENESSVMERMKLSLANHSNIVSVPTSINATKKVLIMSFIEGQSLASIRRSEKERFRNLRKRIGGRLLKTLAGAWGYMIFQEGLFNADLHPGNIVIMPEGRAWGPVGLVLGLVGLNTPALSVGLLDWGQVKELDEGSRERFARLVCAIANKKSQDEVVEAFKGLGIKIADPNNSDSIEKLALVMFDARNIDGANLNPFSQDNIMKQNRIKQYPQDLYFVLRAAIMFRGMSESLKVPFSLANAWAPYATKFLKSQENKK
eukprot:CAMPEP_0171461426 /NCGR_PEP_ID=MMETSP0945-20130129/5880_1 /TAXON_ID=109269 /ORGANISM="Vaucheria litorea, Strain CCMP2940" /LENGTH=496 /DNA_ID=CAMNT_0011987773 /DNA_START=427 /DNA_END=1917 /DNA_ORIENTATION=+